MYRVTLQKTNRLVDKLFNTNVAANDIHQLFMSNLLRVLSISYGRSILKDEVEVNIRGDRYYPQRGQFITVETDAQKKYIFLSYERPENTRNGYIISKIPIALREWYKDTTRNKQFEVFLLDVTKEDYERENYRDVKFMNFSSYTVNAYQTFAYKLCRTLGLRLLNYDILPWTKDQKTQLNHAKSNSPFTTLAELRAMRDGLQRKNTGNKSSYILEDQEGVVIYGKTFGNNGFETILIAAAVKQITTKKVYFWQVKDTNTMHGIDREAKPITTDNLQQLKNFGIKVYDELQEYHENENAKIKERDARNQLEFKKNLIYKFGCDEPECYLCQCHIQNLIIASHIHRVCDINKEKIPFAERRAEAVSADNGLWLCANHDKLFEFGLIYFNEQGEIMYSDKLTDEQKQFAKEISSKSNAGNFSISPDHLTDQMKTFLAKHRQRTNG